MVVLSGCGGFRQVHLRIRPFTDSETTMCAGTKPTITITAEDKVMVEPPEGSRSGERQGTYQFSRVHGPETRQDRFYDAVMKPIVDKAMQTGQNGLMFAYGTPCLETIVVRECWEEGAGSLCAGTDVGA